MFYVMYVSSGEPLLKLVSKLKTYFQSNHDVFKESADEFVVSTNAFTLRVTAYGNNVIFASEDYSTKFEFCFWFEIIISCKSWADQLMRFVNSVLLGVEGDVVLESNGDKPILFRRSGKLYIDKNIGDGSFPFEHITVAYEEATLERE